LTEEVFVLTIHLELHLFTAG